MSINSTCLEYLLSVAEKIIDTCADQPAISKYYKLKQSFTSRHQKNARDILRSISYKENVTDRMRQSIGIESSKCMKRDNSRRSIGNSVRNRSSKELEQCRFDTFGSRTVKKERQTEVELAENHSILNQLASLLKNAETCPNLLKTLTITFDSKDFTLHKAIKSIQTSLSIIHKALIEQPQTPSEFVANESISLPTQQLLSDNKWLISKLQILITENTTLRRMVGSKHY